MYLFPLDYKKVAELDPQNKVATANVYKLGPIVEERREKLKEEMMGIVTSLLLYHVK